MKQVIQGSALIEVISVEQVASDAIVAYIIDDSSMKDIYTLKRIIQGEGGYKHRFIGLLSPNCSSPSYDDRTKAIQQKLASGHKVMVFDSEEELLATIKTLFNIK